jgi:hypothetical protein
LSRVAPLSGSVIASALSSSEISRISSAIASARASLARAYWSR